jgi:cytochrome bd-type quinol oxidase subunit 1
MGEHYVRPPLVAREAPPVWQAVWRFRVTALALLAVLLLLGYSAFQHLSGATDQDPGLSSAPGVMPPSVTP